MVDSPENINREAPRQEMGNREIDALNIMIRSGETAENINNALDKNFLENLKNSLHPDTAKQLRDTIKNITGYDQQNNLKQLYDYVVSICDTFDTTGKENDEHEDITDTLTMNDVLDQRNKDQYIYIINVVENINAVAQDNSIPDNFLSAIKGILNGEKLSGSFLVKMAEFLGIDTKSDNRYGPRRIKNLGEKVFSMTDEKGLFAKLGKMYEHMDTNPNVVKFRNNQFEQHSLNDICNLLKIDWDGSDINKSDTKVDLFCKALRLNTDTFTQQFNTKNLERKNKNNELLNSFSISSLISNPDQITKTDTEGTYKYGDAEFTKDNFMENLNISQDNIKARLEESGAIFAGSELQNAINSKQNDRFNKIIENAHEAPEDLPDKITADDIKGTKMRGKTPVKADDVVNEINTAIDGISTIEDETKKTEIINKITNVISALKNPGDKKQDGSQPNITALQETMKNAGQSLIVDGKFGPNTFGAMKNYINATTISVNPDESNDPESGALDNGGSVETIVNYRQEALNYLNSKIHIKGKNVIQNILNNNIEIGIKYIQLALLPEYKGKIDGKFGPQTLSAFKKYCDIFNNSPETRYNTIGSLLEKNDYKDNGFIDLNEDDMENSFAVINNNGENHAYFIDGTVINYSCRRDTGFIITATIGRDTYSYHKTKGGDSFTKNDKEYENASMKDKLQKIYETELPRISHS